MAQTNGHARISAVVVPVWQPAFLAELEQTGNIAAACRAANADFAAVSRMRRRDQEFDARVRELLRARKLTRDPNDRLIELQGEFAWDGLWPDDEEYTNEQAFLSILSRTLNASEACRRVNVAYGAYSRHRRVNPEFDRLCRLAIGRACDEIEGAVFMRAMIDSDPAALALLKAYRPEVYNRTDQGSSEDGPSLEEAMKRGFERRTASES